MSLKIDTSIYSQLIFVKLSMTIPSGKNGLFDKWH